ncbi:RNA-binding post-transcriptional regulator cip2 [Trichoderma ghanense]|uniref:RNA-binding post-transcriptional regulator cip2 n=1 Tax=Trichoderma ghanense TaxID=65468 RepID=A0ABY2GNZ0_9HYPO
MAQQPHDMSYLDYGTAPNRSPSSSRQNYANFPSGLTMPRQTQRPFDAPLPSNALYSTDRLASSYGSRAMDTVGAASSMPTYMMDNNQSWSYNASGVATVGGAVHGPGRQRSVNRRAALPTNWTEHGGMGMPNLQSYSNGLGAAALANGGLRVDGPGSHPSPNSLQSAGNDADQLIPTAIVIKNIPFAVRKETLASIMLEMHLPQPYAFNYHFDNGVFRGLAFANFQSADDTRLVIDAMNGMDVHGRKLRVEYKKMLPEAERERIEREKRERRGQLEEQHRAPLLHNQSSIQSLGGMSQAQPRTASAAAGPPTSSLLGDIDMNDPQTLEFYTELAMFRRDDSREILVFPPGIAPEHRRCIHILAHHMGLEHQSIGEADSRQLTVLKRQQPSPTANLQTPPASSLDVHKRGLSRAATFDFAADRESRASSSTYGHLVGRHGPTLELPGSPDGSGIPNNLRAAKSFADLRSFTPSPSQASSSYLAPGSGLSSIAPTSTARFGDYLSNGSQSQSGNPSTPGKNDNGLVSGLSGLSLSPFEASSLQSQARNTPGAIGSQRPSANGNGIKNPPERQPRNPEWEASNGFGRTRANGHMQRGSDSSDNGARVGTSSTNASRYH